MSSQSNNENEMIPLESIHEISIKDLAAFRKFQKLQEEASKNHIVTIVSQKNDVNTIGMVEEELAKTIALIDVEIQKRLTEGKSCFEQNSRKIRSLKVLTDIIFAKRQMALNEAINLKSESFEIVFKEILDLVHSSAEKVGVPVYHIEAMFNELTKNLSSWEEQTQKKLMGPQK